MHRTTFLGSYSITVIIIFALAVLTEVSFPAAGTSQLVWKVPLGALVKAFNKSSGIIAFIAVVPSVAIPSRIGGYMEAMETFLSSDTPNRKAGNGTSQVSLPTYLGRITKPFTSFLALAGLQLLMTFVLNIGSIPIMQRLLDKTRLPKRYLSLLYSTAYSSYMVVSPFDGLIQALILAAGSSYAAYAGRGLAMTGAIMTAGLLILALSPHSMRPGQAVHMHQPSEGGQADPESGKGSIPAALGKARPGYRLMELAAHIVAMIVLAVIFGRLVQLRNPAMGTAFVIMVYVVFWLRLLGVDRKQLGGSVREYALALGGFRAFLPFLISASFLGALTTYTPLSEAIGSALMHLEKLPRYFSIQAIMAGTALLSLGGVHMMITVAAISSAVDPAMLGLDPPGFALFLLSCWFVAMNVSPFVPFSTVVGEAIGEKPATVALRYNSKMALLMLLIGPALINLMH
ncbi:MAG: hypothetical protein A3J97_01790 [Spirochaetes bacterium RIFOXYC1_FULL_54_7]|nr:MAG: hypothetical protein A3J97_01790 [Spirochaetes bacterium RIFOXYC1_FULL_54_7]